MKFIRWFLATLAMVTLTPIALLAQVADTTHVASGTSGAPILSALSGYQMLAVTLLGSGLTWLISHFWPGFTNLGNLGKWGIVLASSWVVTVIVHLLHGNVSADVATLIQTTLQAIAAAVTSGSIFKFGTTKPASTT